MKNLLLALTLVASGVSAAHQDAPRHVRVSLQWIEVSHPVLTELLNGESKSGSALHDAVIAYSKQGKAKLLETSMVVCRTGQRSIISSFREEIYPTEYEPPGFNPLPYRWADPTIRSFPAFETRNTGVAFEIEPTLGENESIIDLRFVTDVITRDRLETWMEHKDQWGDASLRMPVFERWSVNTSVILTAGRFEFVSVISPQSALPAPAVQNKILLFVRADVLSSSR